MVIAVVFLPVARCFCLLPGFCMVNAVVLLYVAMFSVWLLQLCFCLLPGVLYGYCSCVSACCKVFCMVIAVVFLPVARCSA